MNIKNLFHRKRSVPVGSADRKPQPLRIEGIGPAPLTPEPDEAELAAQALLEHMAAQINNGITSSRNNDAPKGRPSESRNSEKAGVTLRDAAYYRQLADRIRQAHEAATLRTRRFVAFCEQELQKPDLPLEGPGSLGLLNVELMKRIDVIERRGGELKKRWQHCLATVIVRMMQHSENTTADSTEKT